MSETSARDWLLEKTTAALLVEWERWDATLPPEGKYWPKAAVYIRESSQESLAGDAPVVQLRNTLAMFATEKKYVPWDLVILEQATGTELAARAHFRNLLDRAERGEFKSIGAFLSSRFFRNVEEAIMVKRRMARAGVDLVWVGKPLIDPREPSAFLLERHLEIADEWIPRQTSYQVSRAVEKACEDGIPIGRLPELWYVTQRSEAKRLDRRGSPTKWELVEPIASIVREAVFRYLGGHTFGDLTKWALTTEAKGRTPANRPMDRTWWQWNLKNPKLAGYQYRTDHPGYKPGKESAKRKPLHQRDLVPCLLPPIITLDQHLRVMKLAKERHRGGERRRAGYQVELLSGISYHAECGHKLHIKSHALAGGDDFYIRCGDRMAAAHSKFFRARDASDELDALISRITFDQPLLDRIETRAPTDR